MEESTSETPEIPARGIRRFQHDSATTVAELREFLAQLRGKDSREVVATITDSSLVKSTVVAAIAVVLLLFLTSAAVYFATPNESTSAKTNPSQSSQSNVSGESQTTPSPSEEDKSAAVVENATAAASAPQPATGGGDKTLDLLGVGETKVAPPDENPLDKNLEDLLNKKID